MKSISKYKVEFSILIPIIILSIISLISIYSAESLIGSTNNYVVKQAVFYIIGFILVYLIMFMKNRVILDFALIFYIIGNILLLGLFFFGKNINGSTCWYVIYGIGNFQPSEFMKIALILINAKLINDFNETNKYPSLSDEFLFILKMLGILLIPSILTFLQPDTGVVLIYVLITLSMLFISGIRLFWFILLFAGIGLILGVFFYLYFFNENLFIKLFGNNFFYRMERIINWNDKSGMQYINSITAIGSSGLFGHGFNKTPIYFPEAQTDFIFAVYASNFGLIGSILLISILVFFNIKLTIMAFKTNNVINKYVLTGIITMFIYQQFQNIGMTVGLLPITGITLPFISYGGSSLLSYMIVIGIVFNISNESYKYNV